MFNFFTGKPIKSSFWFLKILKEIYFIKTYYCLDSLNWNIFVSPWKYYFSTSSVWNTASASEVARKNNWRGPNIWLCERSLDEIYKWSLLFQLRNTNLTIFWGAIAPVAPRLREKLLKTSTLQSFLLWLFSFIKMQARVVERLPFQK